MAARIQHRQHHARTFSRVADAFPRCDASTARAGFGPYRARRFGPSLPWAIAAVATCAAIVLAASPT